MYFFGFIKIVEANISLHHQVSITIQHLSDISIRSEIFECRVQGVTYPKLFENCFGDTFYCDFICDLEEIFWVFIIECEAAEVQQ